MSVNNINKKVLKISKAFSKGESNIIPLLQRVQDEFGWIPKEAIEAISQYLEVSLQKIYGVVTFYKGFRLQPIGKYLIQVCLGTACHVAGAPEIIQSLLLDLGIKEGETTEDKLFTVDVVRCLGCCSLGPVLVVNEEVHARVTPSKAKTIIKLIRNREKKGEK
ncbi:MAG: NADH-quinone oxidoreductase subunit NuoE [Candidatus Ranarchaeia archaeon]